MMYGWTESGFGQYVTTDDYAASPAGQAGIRGLGCCCGACDENGVGLFDSGFSDIGAWGWPEWAVVAFGGYILFSVLFTTKTAAREIHSRGREAGRALAGRKGARKR